MQRISTVVLAAMCIGLVPAAPGHAGEPSISCSVDFAAPVHEVISGEPTSCEFGSASYGAYDLGVWVENGVVPGTVQVTVELYSLHGSEPERVFDHTCGPVTADEYGPMLWPGLLFPYGGCGLHALFVEPTYGPFRCEVSGVGFGRAGCWAE